MYGLSAFHFAHQVTDVFLNRHWLVSSRVIDCSVSFDALKPPCSNAGPPVNEMLPELKCDSFHRGGQHLLS